MWWSSKHAEAKLERNLTLDALVMCIRTQMPPSGSNGYVAPTSAQRADWQSIVRQMLQGTCDFAVPPSLSGLVQVRTFADTSNGHSYCLLMEVRDQNGNGIVDNGFGTFIAYNTAARQLYVMGVTKRLGGDASCALEFLQRSLASTSPARDWR